ncbi:hypothetical protein K466DRAFT_251698 [Polyporus arcularius HHB13444]|uniref:Uncharacterized protein n=1 Tax=Polyporus arcularius HHB13444 TaxID=1314778 RepID=A0A5C3PU68_9APHY|nr:hypothetical protein K466DRAFT_251698 [Polyporus arcularius HHB13444]
MDPNGFDREPPFPPPPTHGYYHSVQAPGYNIPQVLPPQMGIPPGFIPAGWPFASPVHQQWVPFYQLQGQGPEFGQQQAHAAGHVGVHRTHGLEARTPREIMTDALRRGKGLGLSQREVLEHLQIKYKRIDWTAYFLDNAVLPSGPGNAESAASRDKPSSARASTSQASQATLCSSEEPARKKSRTTKDTRATGRPPSRGRPRARNALTSQRDVKPSYSRVRSSISTARSSTAASVPGRRPARGGVLQEYHDETYIPPSDISLKPSVPLRLSGEDLHRFSAEEKVFFIQYLRWRLREGRIPSKATLFVELAKELPHHDEDTWKKHWKDHCMLPDEIYIAASKRAEAEGLLSSSESLSDMSTLTPAPSSDEEFRPASPDLRHSPSPPPITVGGFIPSAVYQKVTDEDLRAMAKYMVEKRHAWGQYKNNHRRWEEFSRRKERLDLQNLRRRSHIGWYCAARTYATQIRAFYDEYMAEKPDPASEDERDERETRKLVHTPDQDEEPVVPRTAVPPSAPECPGGLSAPVNAAERPITTRISAPLTDEVEREYIVVSDSD